jgi:RNA polymerase sigma-70 factor (ECF subfamily)
LSDELSKAGKRQYFEQFKGALTDEMSADGYATAAVALDITPAAAKQAAYRLRKRYRELFREEVARTLAPDEDVDEEIERLLQHLH